MLYKSGVLGILGGGVFSIICGLMVGNPAQTTFGIGVVLTIVFVYGLQVVCKYLSKTNSTGD